jgi:hypothetical protein
MLIVSPHFRRVEFLLFWSSVVSSTSPSHHRSVFCSDADYLLESHVSSRHGDVCRHVASLEWKCPLCCHPLISAPYCVNSQKHSLPSSSDSFFSMFAALSSSSVHGSSAHFIAVDDSTRGGVLCRTARIRDLTAAPANKSSQHTRCTNSTLVQS